MRLKHLHQVKVNYKPNSNDSVKRIFEDTLNFHVKMTADENERKSLLMGILDIVRNALNQHRAHSGQIQENTVETDQTNYVSLGQLELQATTSHFDTDVAIAHKHLTEILNEKCKILECDSSIINRINYYIEQGSIVLNKSQVNLFYEAVKYCKSNSPTYIRSLKKQLLRVHFYPV
jgi:hypothetical protein